MQDIHGSQIEETARKVKVFAYFGIIFCQYTVVTIEKNNVWQSVSLLQKKKLKSLRQKFYMHPKINKISRGCFSKEPFNWESLTINWMVVTGT